MKRIHLLLLLLGACNTSGTGYNDSNFRNIRQVTTAGTHAEAYWSFDSEKLILQAKREGDAADRIYSLELGTGDLKSLSSGDGKTTCAYWLPDSRYIYSSTHHHGKVPPPPPDPSLGYVWKLHREFDVFLNDSGTLKQLTNNDGYDAEATVSPDGKRIIFTSHRENMIGLWTMDTDGKNLKKVDHPRGYAGGAFFSPDGKWIVYRAFVPSTPEDEKLYERMLKERILSPVPMELYIARPDGSETRRITSNGKVNFAPAWHPDGKRIIFTSNLNTDRHGQYHLYIINTDGTGLRQLTFGTRFDGFPHFSYDGKHLAWISNRHAKENPRKKLDVFIAEWVDP
jgi:Tol biopolymer transport system component